MPVWPAYVVHDDPDALAFSVAVDEPARLNAGPGLDPLENARRAYLTVLTQRRLHQEGFRERVLRAYLERCAVCRLRRRELLTAAHILPDRHPHGEPVVTNGLALCTLHHTAFDRHVLGIRPDLIVELSAGLLRETDGPMLQHGLQGFHGVRILVPHAAHLRPNPCRRWTAGPGLSHGFGPSTVLVGWRL
jgi:putative restriction endonuclease